MNKPFVSIILCVTRNPMIFRNCLRSLKNQSYNTRDYEILLVDSTEEKSAKRLFSDPLLKIIEVNSKSKGDMLNIGIKAAKGEIVAFIDVDCIADSDWLSNIANALVDKSIAGVGGNVLIGGQSCYDLNLIGATDENGYLKFNKNKIFLRKNPLSIAHFLGANCAFKKAILLKEGGYLENSLSLGVEDVEICMRLLSRGYKLKFIKAPVYHPLRNTKLRLDNAARDGRALCLLLKLYKPSLIKSTYFFLLRNVIWYKGSIFMFFGFLSETKKPICVNLMKP